MKILGLFLSFLVMSCASRTLEKDYKVVDASQQEVPEWVEDLNEWLEDQDTEKFSFYTYTTESKNSRSMACEIAKAKSTALIAEELSTYIKQSFAQNTQGDPTSTDEALSEYVESSLLKVVEANIQGAKTLSTYWEKHRHQTDLGAKKDYEGFVCSAITRISKKQLKSAYKAAQKKLEKKASNASKGQVKKILDQASTNLGM